MPSEMYARFVQHGWDSVDDEIRKHFKIPKNRYYSVTVPPSPAGRVIIDHTRTRVLESVKLSKSDISQHNAIVVAPATLEPESKNDVVAG